MRVGLKNIPYWNTARLGVFQEHPSTLIYRKWMYLLTIFTLILSHKINGFRKQLTFQRPERLIVRVRLVVSTPNTRLPNTRLVRLPCTPKVREDMTVSNPVSVVKPSKFSTRRLRLPRRSFWDWNVCLVRLRPNWLWRDVSTSNWVVKRSKRVKLCNSECTFGRIQKYVIHLSTFFNFSISITNSHILLPLQFNLNICHLYIIFPSAYVPTPLILFFWNSSSRPRNLYHIGSCSSSPSLYLSLSLSLSLPISGAVVSKEKLKTHEIKTCFGNQRKRYGVTRIRSWSSI